jgi:hypothetical protein
MATLLKAREHSFKRDTSLLRRSLCTSNNATDTMTTNESRPPAVCILQQAGMPTDKHVCVWLTVLHILTILHLKSTPHILLYHQTMTRQAGQLHILALPETEHNNNHPCLTRLAFNIGCTQETCKEFRWQGMPVKKFTSPMTGSYPNMNWMRHWSPLTLGVPVSLMQGGDWSRS